MQEPIPSKQYIEEEILKKAEQIARKAHRGQKRKDGKPYITHPEAVASACGDIKRKADKLNPIKE